MNMMAILWLALIVIFLITEAFTVMLVSIWFAAGALAALIVYFLGGSWAIQVVVALVVSAGLLLLLRPLTRKYFTPRLTKTNVDSVIGTTGYVTAAVDNAKAQGQAKLGAMEWTARSTTGEPIAEGILVRVDRVEGVKVFVTPAEVLEKV